LSLPLKSQTMLPLSAPTEGWLKVVPLAAWKSTPGGTASVMLAPLNELAVKSLKFW
jgi:hypothetical protein